MIKSLDNNMYYLSNLEKYTKHIINYDKGNNKKINILDNIECKNIDKNKDKDKDKDKDFFIPDKEDKLFWCFYILTYGFDKYEFIKNNSFKFEKDFKIKTIEEMRKQKDLLKAFKIKNTIVENELLNDKVISIKTLNLLALIYKQNFVYISGRTYLLINYSNDEKIYDTKNIIIKDGKDYKIYYNSDIIELNERIKKDLDDITNNYWKVEDINKFIRAISAYTISQLNEIATKLNISIINELNKKKTKKELYDEILLKLNN
jgi:hypothetical protein